jgi:hypothetical protein
MPSQKTIHESNIIDGLTKAKFDNSKATVHYELDRRDTKESYKPTIHDSGHKDLWTERKKAARLVLDLLEAPDDWKQRCIVTEVRQDLKSLELEFKIGINIPWNTEPFVIGTPKLNDLTYQDIKPLMEEVAKFVTGQKRSQQELDLEAA